MKIRLHRHKFVADKPVGLVQVVRCTKKNCGYSYEQFLLFDLRKYGRVAA